MEVRQNGCVTLTLPDGFVLPQKAGLLDPLEVQRIPKVPQQIGLICEHVADALELLQGKITIPQNITPASLREVGQKAIKIEQILQHLEGIAFPLRQAAMLIKAEAFEQVCQVNDVVVGYGKRNRDVWSYFGLLRNFFSKIRGRRRGRLDPLPQPNPPGNNPIATD